MVAAADGGFAPVNYMADKPSKRARRLAGIVIAVVTILLFYLIYKFVQPPPWGD
jgi:hypothetical protein